MVARRCTFSAGSSRFAARVGSLGGGPESFEIEEREARMYRGIRLSVMGATLSALVTLYGCGGGSDDGDDTPTSAKGGPLVRGEAVQEARAAAAGATPQFETSSVTQSNATGTVTVTVSEDGHGDLQVSAMYDGEDGVDTGSSNAEQGTNLFHVAGREKGTQLFERFEDGDVQGADFYRRLSLNGEELNGAPAGDLWVHVQTNFDGDDIDHTNYIAGGYWVFISDDEEEDPTFGVFVDGAMPASVLDALVGTAEYAGTATGVYSTGDGKQNREFDAKVALEADFMANDEAGEIGGSITDFLVDGRALANDPTVTLDTATLTTDMSRFSGETAMTYGAESYSGTWGGHFYNPNTDDTVNEDRRYPGAVAGTFGAATEGGENSFIGIFSSQVEE